MMMPINAVGGPSAAEVIQQAFNPAIAVLASPDVDVVCSKNRLTFVELLQPFSRLSVEGQIRDVNQALHSVTHFRLSVRDITWRPASSVLARRLLSEAVTNFPVNENKVAVIGGADPIEINPHTPWYDSWRETLWSCLDMTDHDFARHYLATLLVVSSSHPNPLEQFQQLNDQLTQLMSSNGTADGPRWFNMMSLRYHVLVHDACDGDAFKAEELLQTMRNAYGSHGCQLLVINSKPKKGSIIESGLPAPDPWLRFLPRKASKLDVSTEGESTVDGVETGEMDFPVKVVEGTNPQSLGSLPKIPLMDALQEAMQEININSVLAPSASTSALSSLTRDDKISTQNNLGLSQRSAVEIKDDPLNAVLGSTATRVSLDEADGTGPILASSITSELHGGCLTTEDLDRIQSLINDFCLKSLLPHIERQMRLLNESASSRKSTHRSLLSATKRWFGSNRPGGVQTPQTVAVSYHPESVQLQVRRLGDLAFLVGHYDLAYHSYHSAKKDFEADQAWLHYAGAMEMAALSVFLQNGQSRNVPFHYFDKSLTTYLQTCKMPYWATRCAVLASECLKATNQYSDAALQLIRLTSEDADLRSAILLEQAALCFLRSAVKPNSSADAAKPNMVPLIRKYAFHMILAGHRFGKSGQKRHAARAYQLALQVYKGHGWSLAEDHIHYTVGRQCLNRQQIEAACHALAALLKPDSMQTAAQQTAYLNEFIHVHQLLNKHRESETNTSYTLPILPLPVIDSNQIRVLVDTKEPTENMFPPVSEATHVTFNDDEVHHAKWTNMEEKLVNSAFGTTHAVFRPTNLIFSHTTNNMVHPQTNCDDLVSFELPLTNPLRIPVQLCDVRLVWNFAGGDGNLSNLLTATENPLVTTYILPRIVLNPSSSHKIILNVKPKAEGILTIEGVAFDLRPVNVEPSAAVVGLVSSVPGRVMFSLRGPRLNTTQQERQGKVYATDKRLSIQVGPRMPKLQVLFRSLPEFMFSGEIRPVVVELSNLCPNIPISNIMIASNDPLHVAFDVPRIDNINIRHDQVALYRWDPSQKSTTIWLKGTENVGLTSLDLMFFSTNPAVKARRYRLLRHCSKIFVSSSLSLAAWVQRVPSGEDRTETLAAQLQVRNLRDADDTSLSGIEISQVALLSNRWLLRPQQSTIPGGVLHPQESLIGVLLAIRGKENIEYCESATLKLPSHGRAVDFKQGPYRTFVREFQRDTPNTTLVVCWTATQASEDGFGTLIIEGQHYFGWNSHDIANSSSPDTSFKLPQQLVSYSMEYSPKVYHDFNKQRLCVIPVILYLYNCCQKEIDVSYSANFNIGKTPRASQLYMPEAASPLLWIGRVQGNIHVRDTPEAVHLAIAVSRPGAYSLVQGLHIDGRILDQNVKVPSSKIEYTLVVYDKEV
ncbi:trafficking protein particle complex subunit 8-like isoform X1 [Daphnia carinata]|uniref:trafficking protein particle complex subunit 8-like isoform X1 n=1 Tax=Daphnia carinata TaxID=120202 RepID=UPI0028697452|nr:trafficking protein particle complex subunit 8-like isoform X1 [Daphnia carinata]